MTSRSGLIGTMPTPEVSVGQLTTREFRSILGRFASGVTVVTTELDGEIGGMTVSAFSSVALEPPLVLVCLTIDKPATKLVFRSGRFAVNILSSGQEQVSEDFAYLDPGERFDRWEWAPGPHGLPLLAGTLASLECRVVQRYEAGDHVIFVGEAIGGEIGDDEDPLIYTQGEYRRLTP